MFAALLCVASGIAPAQQGTRVGYVDMKRVLDAAPQLAAGRAAIATEFAERDAALKTQTTRLEELEAAFRREGDLLPADVAESRRREIEALRRGIERARERMRDELKTRSEDELNRRWPEIQDAIIAYARANGIDLVVQSPVIYASATIDITDAVIEDLARQSADATASAPR
ncbi:MAG: OmpH family outer membrane protein [Burkholderiales bacterium]|nr:OmpH family outer membrane protein [Burkholderiales bacterium]